MRLLKVDVQGAEYDLLDGARTLFDQHGVDIAYIEFSGDERITEFFAERGYRMFDTEYQIVLGRIAKEEHHWKVLRQGAVSTGAKVGFGWPVDCPRDIKSYAAFIEQQRRSLGHVQTDLVCVAPSIAASFEAACYRTANSG